MSPPTDSGHLGLILFSHGSLLCGSGRMLQRHIDRLRKSGNYLAVEPGYLNYCSPPIEEAVARCAAAGATKIIVVPYFLVTGKFVSQDLPTRLKSAMATYPGIRYSMAAPLEDAAPMVEALNEIIDTAESPDQWQARAITRAHGECELRENCPLYGSPMCRKRT